MSFVHGVYLQVTSPALKIATRSRSHYHGYCVNTHIFAIIITPVLFVWGKNRQTLTPIRPLASHNKINIFAI